MTDDNWQWFHPGELEQSFQEKYGTLDTAEKKARALCELVDRGFILLTSIAQAWQAVHNYTHPADQEEMNYIFRKCNELSSSLSSQDYAVKVYGDFYTTYVLFTRGASTLDQLGNKITPKLLNSLREEYEKEELKILEASADSSATLN